MISPAFAAVHVVPSGIGAAIGGYAGDATPATNLLAAACDLLLTHPNAVNAAGWMAAAANVLYTDGYWLDEFMQGRCALVPTRANRVGVLIDRAAEAWLPMLLNAVEAARAVQGIPIAGWALTDEPVAGRVVAAASGGYQGAIPGSATLLRGAEVLVAAGAQAIAVFTCIGDLPAAAVAAYERGAGPDPIGGIEAAISRALARATGLPVAHAPVFPPEIELRAVDPRVAAEAAALTFIPCVLQGLHRSPRPHPLPDGRGTVPGQSHGSVPRPSESGSPAAGSSAGISLEAIAALVTPGNALGGPSVFAAHERGIPIIAVRQNRTILNVDKAALGWNEGVWEVENYLEAAGLLLAWRQGIDPLTVQRPLQPLERRHGHGQEDDKESLKDRQGAYPGGR